MRLCLFTVEFEKPSLMTRLFLCILGTVEAFTWNGRLGE